MSLVATTEAHHEFTWQQSLFALDSPGIDVGFRGANRSWLDDMSWVDLVPGWMSGASQVFAELAERLSWRRRQVVMYQRVLPEPRLTSWWSPAGGDPEPVPVLADARSALIGRYSRPFDSIGFNLYCDGRDSVAWHADRERYEHEDPIVAIVSTGAPRPFRVRRKGGGAAWSWSLGHGDLLVMGGACQHDYEHAVPKVAVAEGPRLSIMFRHNLADWQPPADGDSYR